MNKLIIRPVLEEELSAFVVELDKLVKAEFALLYPTLAANPDYVPSITAGSGIASDVHTPGFKRGPRKFVRIVKSDKTSRSAYCFIEIATGNILKTSSWQTPAKHARGNIRSPYWGTALNLNGAAYLR